MSYRKIDFIGVLMNRKIVDAKKKMAECENEIDGYVHSINVFFFVPECK